MEVLNSVNLITRSLPIEETKSLKASVLHTYNWKVILCWSFLCFNGYFLLYWISVKRGKILLSLEYLEGIRSND